MPKYLYSLRTMTFNHGIHRCCNDSRTQISTQQDVEEIHQRSQPRQSIPGPSSISSSYSTWVETTMGNLSTNSINNDATWPATACSSLHRAHPHGHLLAAAVRPSTAAFFFRSSSSRDTATVAAATHPRGASRNVASYSLSACVMLVGRVGLSRCSGRLVNDCTYSRLLLDRVKETESITMARFSLVRPRSIDCATTCCHRCLRRAPLPRARECQLDLSTPTVIGS
jgi:hypothetical protein